MTDFELERHSRTEMLLGEGAAERLGRTRVAIFGMGGVGGYALEALVRTGVLNIDVIDADTVSPSNLNRQIIALESTVGRMKTEAARERALAINSAACIKVHSCFYSPEDECGICLSDYDYIIDAIDTVDAKCHLIKRAAEAGVPIISSMGTGGKTDPTKIKIADIYKTSVCPLARTVRTRLRKMGIKSLRVVYSEEEPRRAVVEDTHGDRVVHRAPGSIMLVPAAAGLAMAYEVINYLLTEGGKE
ncbi:MAG: tRNA threonylcarbamoyladenosine dehydratase [Clostridia bacterium]|nr:tRNA threonylcarbamoyladenosine dehydratase [Clostridia bacterium]